MSLRNDAVSNVFITINDDDVIQWADVPKVAVGPNSTTWQPSSINRFV